MCRAAQFVLIACVAGSAGCMAMPYGEVGPPSGTSAERARAALRARAQLVAEFDAAVALVAGLRFKQANEEFAELVQGFEAAGDDARAAEATFWMGYCYEKRDRPEDAAAFYKRVQSRYPRTPAARHAGLRLARLSKPRKP